MNLPEIKQLLDEKYLEYCKSDFFIETDPIQIPKMFEEKEDIEIAGFLAASLAWGQRPTIIKKCKELMQLMDYAPADFIRHAGESDLERFCHFKHRTFNAYDCRYFIRSLSNIYRHHGGLESVFTTGWKETHDMFAVYTTGMPYSPNSRRKAGFCATLPTPAKALLPNASICICAGWSAATRAASILGCGKKFPHPPCLFHSIYTPAMSAGSWDYSPAIKTIAGRYRNSLNASGNSIPPTRSVTISPCSA